MATGKFRNNFTSYIRTHYYNYCSTCYVLSFKNIEAPGRKKRMILKKLKLTNFRNHKSAQFALSDTTVIIGRNTAGKTNILEAIYILSRGKSFRAEHDKDTIREGADFARIEAAVIEDPAGAGQTTDL